MARIDCASTLERSRRALRAHRSQVDPNGRWFALPAEMIVAAYPWEDFELLATRVPVADGHEDLFQGL